MQKILIISGFGGKEETTFPTVCRVKGTNSVVYINGTSRKEDLRDLLGLEDDMDIEEMQDTAKDVELYVLAEESIQTLTRDENKAVSNVPVSMDANGEPLYELKVPIKSLTLVECSPEVQTVLEACQDSDCLTEFLNRDKVRKAVVAQVASNDRNAVRERELKARAELKQKMAERRAGKVTTVTAAAAPAAQVTTVDDSLGQ